MRSTEALAERNNGGRAGARAIAEIYLRKVPDEEEGATGRTELHYDSLSGRYSEADIDVGQGMPL